MRGRDLTFSISNTTSELIRASEAADEIRFRTDPVFVNLFNRADRRGVRAILLGRRLKPGLGRRLKPGLGRRLKPGLGRRLEPRLGRWLEPGLGSRLETGF